MIPTVVFGYAIAERFAVPVPQFVPVPVTRVRVVAVPAVVVFN